MTKQYRISLSMLVVLSFPGLVFAAASCDTNCSKHCERSTDTFGVKVIYPGSLNQPCYDLCKQEVKDDCDARERAQQLQPQ
jgi:hypothetical protein